MHRISAVVLVVLGALLLAACDTGEDITLDEQVPAEVREAAGDGEDEGEGEGGDDGDGGNGAAADGEAVEFEAFDLGFNAPAEVPAGEVTFVLDNTGNLPHDLTIDELDETVVETDGGETEQGTIELEPGTYTVYCSVPGHRSSMEVTIEAG